MANDKNRQDRYRDIDKDTLNKYMRQGTESAYEDSRSIPFSQETQIRAIVIVDELIRKTPHDDDRLQYLILLRHQLDVDEQQFTEAQELIAKVRRSVHQAHPARE